MNLLGDESVERPVVERLRLDGHDVVYVAELAPSIVDEEVLRQANARGAVLVTADKDFGELVFRQGLVHSGVVLLRLAGLANATRAEIVAEVCRLHASRTHWSLHCRHARPSPDPAEAVTLAQIDSIGRKLAKNHT